MLEHEQPAGALGARLVEVCRERDDAQTISTDAVLKLADAEARATTAEGRGEGQ